MKRTLALSALLIGSILACDPTHTDQVNALGDEAPNVRPGPTHRPGQPCLDCHDGAIGDPQEFSLAGTVYRTAEDPTGAGGVSVFVTDSKGTSRTFLTNSAGNFYVTPNEWTPVYPLQAQILSGDTSAVMRTLIARDGACSGCHVNPASASSPGRVVLELADGGTPP